MGLGGTPATFPPAAYDVKLGTVQTSGAGGEDHHVSAVVLDPAFSAATGAEDDVALLELTTPSAQMPVPIAAVGERAIWKPGALAAIAGFGTTAPSGTAKPATMQVANVPITTDAYCAAAYPPAPPMRRPTTAASTPARWCAPAIPRADTTRARATRGVRCSPLRQREPGVSLARRALVTAARSPAFPACTRGWLRARSGRGSRAGCPARSRRSARVRWAEPAGDGGGETCRRSYRGCASPRVSCSPPAAARCSGTRGRGVPVAPPPAPRSPGTTAPSPSPLSRSSGGWQWPAARSVGFLSAPAPTPIARVTIACASPAGCSPPPAPTRTRTARGARRAQRRARSSPARSRRDATGWSFAR